MSNFFHRLFNPHCEHCGVCPSCETLKMVNERLSQENNRLLEVVLQKPKEEVVEESKEVLRPLPNSRMIPWNVRKRMLETEDREQARLKKEKVDSIEKELGIENA